MRPAGSTLDPLVVDRISPAAWNSLRSASSSAKYFLKSIRWAISIDSSESSKVAHQRLDDRAAQDVVGVELDAAIDRQDAGVEAVVVLVERLDVLLVGSARPCRSPKSRRRAGHSRRRWSSPGNCGAGALALRHGQFVVGLGEMIHADIDATGLGQFADRQRQDLHARIGARQIGIGDAAAA